MPDIFSYPFFQNAAAALTVISIVSAMIGTYIVTRRLVAISGGITHACFGGLGLGYYFGVNPILMAGVFAVASAVGVEFMATRARVREDSAIAVVWALGMAVGILFVFLTPGYVPELNSFLFGNVLTVTRADLLAFGVFAVVVALFYALMYRSIVLCAFDPDFARVMHLPVRFVNYAMTVLIAVCIVLTIRLVGVMLLMSMFALPQMVAEMWCRRFASLMWLSMAVSLVCCLGGLMLGTVIDVPASALIVLTMVAAYVVAAVARPVVTALRRRRESSVSGPRAS